MSPALAAGEANRNAIERLSALGERFAAAGWRPAREVLVPVRAVPTVFPSVDLATRVGGWPTDRIALVHGPSNHGKSEFCHGLGLSFLRSGHAYGYIDAEFTTPSTWLQQLMRDFSQNPGFVALRPSTYEQTVEMVERFCTTVGEAKQQGKVDATTTALVVVDSLRKLVPKRLLETMLKEEADADEAKGAGGRKKKAGGVDGMSGRAAMYKAALNAAWMDRLVPLLAQTGCGMILVGREYEDPDAGLFSKQDWKVGGGRSPYYDSSLVVRIERDGWVRESAEANALIYGERHRVTIHKTKVGPKEERTPEAFFHTSNGVVGPVGFDHARDLLEVARERGIVTAAGASLALGKRTLGRGAHAAVARLYSEPDLMAEITTAVRAEVAASLAADARTRGEEVAR